jgi:chemotaxis protein CheX
MQECSPEDFKPLVKGAIEVFDELCGLKATPVKGQISACRGEESFDIGARIHLKSERTDATCSLLFKEAVYLKIMSRMFEENMNSVTEELKDGASELLNMIFGKAKTVMNERGFALKMALPEIIGPADLSAEDALQQVAIPFDSEDGSFWLELRFYKPLKLVKSA